MLAALFCYSVDLSLMSHNGFYVQLLVAKMRKPLFFSAARSSSNQISCVLRNFPSQRAPFPALNNEKILPEDKKTALS